LIAVDDLAHLAAGGLDVNRAVAHRDRVAALSYQQRGIDHDQAIGVDYAPVRR
jgi:hypothetical protein